MDLFKLDFQYQTFVIEDCVVLCRRQATAVYSLECSVTEIQM